MYTIIAICFCIVIAVIDIKTFRIPDVLLFSFALVLFFMEKSQPHTLLIARISTALIAFLLFGVVWYYSQGMGFGDVKYATLLGYLLGPDKLIQAFFYTALLSIVVYMLGIILFRWPKTTKIPFAPFLSAGAILALPINIQSITGVTE
ncbi:MAG: A24 family peptidase [Treponema sp.]|nr:A24 family peptidase [Treponema sp.]